MRVRKVASNMHLVLFAREDAASKTPPTQQYIAAQSDLETPFSNALAFFVSIVRAWSIDLMQPCVRCATCVYDS